MKVLSFSFRVHRDHKNNERFPQVKACTDYFSTGKKIFSTGIDIFFNMVYNVYHISLRPLLLPRSSMHTWGRSAFRGYYVNKRI